MAIMPLELFRKKKTVEKASTIMNNKNYKNFIVKTIGFISEQSASRQSFAPSEYDLEEIKAAIHSDSYIKTALSKYSNLMYKAGYSLKSENDAATEYLKKRFKIMSFATGKPMDILWQEVSDDIIKYSNAFLIKSRVDNIMPGITAKPVFGMKPIGGYFRVAPETIQIKRDKTGKVIKYKQAVAGEEKEYMPSDVVHIYLDKDANNAFGTPRIQSALEDVKLLRRIEGNVISLIYRFAIPIYQWMIGLPEPGFQATDKEIREAEYEIERMPLDGVIVTNEKTSIKAIGAEGHALDASKYLEYFEKRVFTALDVSASQMGRGGSKQDADSMEAQTHDTIKHIQRTISIFIENFILNELLMEGGFNPIFEENDEVKYVFEEISLDTKVKVENHEMLKYQSNLITFEEARTNLGKKSDVDESGLYINKIENSSMKEQTKVKTDEQIRLAKEQGKINQANQKQEATGVIGNGTLKSKAPNKDAETRNRPENQNGKTSVKIKESLKNKDHVGLDIKSHKKYFSDLYNSYAVLCNDMAEDGADKDILLPIGKDVLRDKVYEKADEYKVKAFADATRDYNKISKTYNLIPNADVPLDRFKEEINDKVTSMMKDIKSDISKDGDINDVFDKYEYRLRYMIEHVYPKIYWYSYIKAAAILGVEKCKIEFSSESDAEGREEYIDTRSFTINEIPSFHSFCKCEVKLVPEVKN